MKRLLVLPAVLALLVGFAVFPGTQTSQGAVACPPTSLTRTGAQASGINQANSNGTWNLTGATWNETGGSYVVRSESWTNGCIVGGTINGLIPRTSTRDQWYNGEDGGAPYTAEGFRPTLTSGSSNFLTIRDSAVRDVEDAYDPNGTNSAQLITLDHVRAEWIRDDCIENEGSTVASMHLKNVLFDGCFTGFAMRPSGVSSSSQGSGDATFLVENSLVYIQPQPLGSIYCSSTHVERGRCQTTGTSGGWTGAHGIWKWSVAAPETVTIRNTIFRLDMPSVSSCRSQEWPTGTYENVTLVWTNSQTYASAGDCTNRLPAGVTLTTDVSVWDNAKAAWLDGSTPTQSPTPTSSVTPTPTSCP